jgi:hypothetical protein
LFQKLDLYEGSSTDFERLAARYWRRIGKRLQEFDATVTQWESKIRKFNEEIERTLDVDLSSHSPKFDAYKAALWVAMLRVVATFAREYLGPSLKKWSPRFFGDGAPNLEMLAKRRSEAVDSG